MSYVPVGDKVLVELDPETRMLGTLHMPDKHSLKYCKRCDRMMEALDAPCLPVDVHEWDKYHDRPVLKGQDTSHEIQYAEAPVVQNPSRVGTVLDVGPKVQDIRRGDRILVASTAGGALDDIRLVREFTILGMVEDD